MSIKIPTRVDSRFRGGMAGVQEIDRRALASDLRKEVEGEVRFDTATRALYAIARLTSGFLSKACAFAKKLSAQA